MQKDFDLSGVKVHIAVPAYQDLRPQTAMALAETAVTLTREGILFNIVTECECCYVDLVRNYIADEFLRTPATHLFMIDSDISWRAHDLLRVLAHTTIADCVAATYRMRVDEEQYAVNLVGTVQVNEYGCIPASGLGLGFCCVQRHVIERLAGYAPVIKTQKRPEGLAQIFRCDTADGWYRGEDIAFFADLKELGHKTWLDLGVDLDHHGRKAYRGSFLRFLEAYQRQGGDGVGTLGRTTVWRAKPEIMVKAEWRFPAEVPGWLSELEGKALAELAANKAVLEIGSLHGRSTISMAQVAACVDSIDPHTGDAMAGRTNTLESFRTNLAKHGVDGKVRVHVGRTQDIAPSIPSKTFDMVFIDGAHDEDSVRLDVAEALRLVRPGGVIAMHDFRHPDVKRVWQEKLGEHVGYADGLAWFQVA